MDVKLSRKSGRIQRVHIKMENYFANRGTASLIIVP